VKLVTLARSDDCEEWEMKKRQQTSEALAEERAVNVIQKENAR
jgi:hypothetical protein